MKTITKQQAVELIRNTNGKIFAVDFVKKSGELRHMVARLGVTSHLAGGESTIKHKTNLISCYDMQNGYRCINADTLKSAKIGGQEYKVEG